MKKTPDKFLGAVFGTAISDALSIPYETVLTVNTLRKLRINTQEYQQIENKGAGFYSFQTEILLTIIKSVIETGKLKKEKLFDALLELWETENFQQKGLSTGAVLEKIIAGEKPDKALASVGKADYTPLLRGIPAGLWCYDEKLKNFVKNSALTAEITHKDYRVIAGTVAVAAAAAYLAGSEPPLKTKEFLNYVATAANEIDDKMAEYIYSIIKLSGKDVESAEMKLKKTGNDDFSPYSDGGGVPAFSISVLLISLYHFITNSTDFHALISSLVKSGGVINATCTLAGGLWGAFNGYNKLPAHLATSLHNKETIYTLAVKFCKMKWGISG